MKDTNSENSQEKKQISECGECGRTSLVVDLINCPFCNPPQPESEGVEDWEKEFDKFMVNEYSKWKIGRVECKNFIRSLLETQAKQIREEERERAGLQLTKEHQVEVDYFQKLFNE